MGSTMKPTIFNEKVATALRNWHHTARKHIKQNRGSVTPTSSRPGTPSHHMSPVHLLRHYRSELDSVHTSPRRSNFDHWDPVDSPSPSHHFHRHPHGGADDSVSNSHHPRDVEAGDVYVDRDFPRPDPVHAPDPDVIEVGPKEFSFDKRVDRVWG